MQVQLHPPCLRTKEERKFTKCPECCQVLKDGEGLCLELWLRLKLERILVARSLTLSPSGPSTCRCFVLNIRAERAQVREPQETAEGAAEAAGPSSSGVSPQPSRPQLPCGGLSPGPSMVHNLHSETVSCSTAVKQTCHYHVSSLRKKLFFLRAK